MGIRVRRKFAAFSGIGKWFSSFFVQLFGFVVKMLGVEL